MNASAFELKMCNKNLFTEIYVSRSNKRDDSFLLYAFCGW